MHMFVPPLAALAAVVMLPSLASAQEPYLDNRSTPEAVIASFYNAINLHQYPRAFSYYQDGQGLPKFADFAKGYADTASVKVTLGTAAGEGAAGSTYWTLPVSLDALNAAGKHSYFSGCYTLRQVSPGMQTEPPFRPLHIVEGHLKKAKGAGKSFLPTDCAP